MIKGTAVSQKRGDPQTYDFELQNYPKDPVVKCECEYPYSEFLFLDAKGDTAVGGSVAQYLSLCGVSAAYPDLLDLELLYVGQAYGDEGSRMAPQRLGSHETLQRVLAETNRQSPDMEIWIILFSFEDMLIASFDGRTGVYDKSDEEDKDHLIEVLATPITEAQRINYCEAALIRHFQPQYNVIFKNSFPNASHTSYSECYKLDLNSVAVEIDCNDVGARFWSPTITPQWVHLIRFALHSEAERRSMFDYFPEIILPRESPTSP